MSNITLTLDSFINAMNNASNQNTTDAIMNRDLLINILDPNFFGLILISFVGSLVMIPLFTSLIFNVFDRITYDKSLSVGLPREIAIHFTNRLFNNSHTFLLLFLLGVTALLVVIIFDIIKNKGKNKVKLGKVTVEVKNNKKINLEEKENNNQVEENKTNVEDFTDKENDDGLEEIKLNVLGPQFQKCTVESNRQYFILNYFIRVYQITMTKVTLTCLIVINNSDLPTSKLIDVIFTYLIFIFWVIGLPCFLFGFLRKHYSYLMSPIYIIKYGTLYLNYRGISKDVFAFLMQVKFSVLPIICAFFHKFPKVQLILLVILYFFNVMFVTIYTPFCKMNKVFTEAISEGVMLFFTILLLVLEVYPLFKQSLIPGYIALGLIFVLLFFRAYRIIIDTVIRIKDLYKIKQPIVIGVDEAYIPKSEREKREEELRKLRELRLLDKKDLFDIDEDEEGEEENLKENRITKSRVVDKTKIIDYDATDDKSNDSKSQPEDPAELSHQENNSHANLSGKSKISNDHSGRQLLNKSNLDEDGLNLINNKSHENDDTSNVQKLNQSYAKQDESNFDKTSKFSKKIINNKLNEKSDNKSKISHSILSTKSKKLNRNFTKKSDPKNDNIDKISIAGSSIKIINKDNKSKNYDRIDLNNSAHFGNNLSKFSSDHLVSFEDKENKEILNENEIYKNNNNLGNKTLKQDKGSSFNSISLVNSIKNEKIKINNLQKEEQSGEGESSSYATSSYYTGSYVTASQSDINSVSKISSNEKKLFK